MEPYFITVQKKTKKIKSKEFVIACGYIVGLLKKQENVLNPKLINKEKGSVLQSE